jgi:Pyruvate/2-oxoacid:ferredoxin oxidoreductase gamma subunit
MEREILFTGIGGQGIQLMAKVLAQAVAADGRHAMLFGVYHGAMRGGASDTTLVVGDAPIEAPPIVPACWAIVAMHPRSLDALARKLRPSGLLFANATLVEAPRDVPAVRVPATRLAEEAGNAMGAGMLMLGAFVAHTGVASLDAVVAAMRAALPPHRARQADANAAMLARGAAWIAEAGRGAGAGAA